MTKKAIYLLALAITLVFAIGEPAQAQQRQTVQQVYDQAVKDFEAGSYDAAKAGFEAVLRAKPGYVYARNYLAKTETAMKNPPAQTETMEKDLAAITVPKVAFEAATLGTVLTYLTQKSEELSNGKVVANFIYKGPAEDRESKTLTLNLSNLPMTEVIRYVGLHTGTRFTYEKYAVVGIPSGDAAKADAATAQTEEAKIQQQAPQKTIFEQREEQEKASRDPFR